eukprot:3903804-Rhodomonas_salina.1
MLLDGTLTPTAIGGIDGNFGVSVQNQVVTLTRTGGTEVAENTVVQVSIDGVRNRITEGGTTNFTIQTAISDGSLIDEDLAVTEVYVDPGNLTNTSVTPADLRAFFLTSYSIAFTTGGVGLPSNSTISITLPTGVNASGAEVDTQKTVGLDGNLAVSVIGQVVALVRSGGTPASPYDFVNITLRQIRNYYAEYSGTYQIQTFLTSTGGLMEEDLAVAGNMLVPAPLTVKNISFGDDRAGANTWVNLSLILSSKLNLGGSDGGKIDIELPDGFYFPSFPAVVSEQLPEPNAQFVVRNSTSSTCVSRTWLQCANLTLQLVGGGEWAYGAALEIAVSVIRNRPISGTSGTFRITTLSTADQVADRSEDFTVVMLINDVKNFTASPTSLIANTSDIVTIRFEVSNVVPPDCRFLLTLPDELTFEDVIGIASENFDGAVSVYRDFREVLVNRSTRDPTEATEKSGVVIVSRAGGTLLEQGTNIVFQVGNLLKKESSGFTAGFSIAMTTFDNITMDQAQDTSALYFIYETPVITSIDRTNGPTVGAASITVSGSNYGPIKVNAALRGASEQRELTVGGSICQSTSWTSDTAMVCTLPDGVGAAKTITVNVENQTSNYTSFTHDGPVASSLFFVNMFGASASTLTVVGENLGSAGYSTRVRLAGTACEATEWRSDTSTSCHVASGIGGTLALILSGGDQVGSISECLSFDTSGFGRLSLGNSPSSGSLSVTVSGQGLGSVEVSQTSRFGGSAGEASGWISDSSIVCAVPSSASGTTTVVLTASSLVASLSQALSFEKATVGTVFYNTSALVNITGSNFGSWDISSTAQLGGTACESSEWSSTSSVLCKGADGFARTVSVVMTGGLSTGSLSEAISFDSPVMQSVADGNLDIGGATLLSLSGSMFGSSDYSSSVRAGGTACEVTTWTSSSTVNGLVASGTSGSLRLIFTGSGTMHSISSLLSYQ